VTGDSPSLLRGAGRNQSLARAFQVLEFLAARPGGASVAEVARATGLPRATVTRLLASLADEDAARRVDGAWRLGPRVAQLAGGPAAPLPARAQPLLEELAAALGETVMLGVPEGAAGARVVAEAEGPRMVGVGSWLGRTLEDPASGFVRLRLAWLEPEARRRAVAGLRFVPHTASTIRSARPLLAAVERIARDGYAEVVDEFEQGLAGLAVPVGPLGTVPSGVATLGTVPSGAAKGHADAKGTVPARRPARRPARLVAMLAAYLPTARLDDAMRERALGALRGGVQSLTGASDTTISSSSSQTR
jgi:DNA-binding IclR family transcriptional regulator